MPDQDTDKATNVDEDAFERSVKSEDGNKHDAAELIRLQKENKLLRQKLEKSDQAHWVRSLQQKDELIASLQRQVTRLELAELEQDSFVRKNKEVSTIVKELKQLKDENKELNKSLRELSSGDLNTNTETLLDDMMEPEV